MKTRLFLCSLLTFAWASAGFTQPVAEVITGLVESGGVGEPTAKFTGQTFEGGGGLGTYTVPFFDEDVKTFTDRTHEWNGATEALPLPEYLVGGEYIMIRNDNRDAANFRLDITISLSANVYMLVDNRYMNGSGSNPPTIEGTPMAWLFADGWEPVRNGHNRTGNLDWPDEVGVDEGAGGIGPGMAINQYSSIYHRVVEAGTFSTFQMNEGGRNMYGIVITAAVPPEEAPPRVVDLAPASGALFHNHTQGISFTVTTVSPNTLPTGNIGMVLNGANVSLQIGGTETARTVSYAGLAENTIYSGTITASDNQGRETTVAFNFDTFNEATSLFIEAEDFNFADGIGCDGAGQPIGSPTVGGSFIDNPTPSAFLVGVPINQDNGYVDRVGAPGIDFFDTSTAGGNAQNNAYRFCDPVGTQATTDVRRQKYIDASLAYSGTEDSIPDYHVHQVMAGEWLNYTRTFPDANYAIYLRYSASAAQSVRLSTVQGNPSQADQTTLTLGTFASSSGGFHYARLVNDDGVPVVLNFAGVQTLRLTALDANNNISLNYLLLTPTTEPVTVLGPNVLTRAPAAGATDVHRDTAILVEIENRETALNPDSVQLEINGATVTGLNVTPTATGATVQYQPPSPFEPGAEVMVKVSYQDTDENAFASEWSFTASSDVEPPTLMSARGSILPETGEFRILVTFSEQVDAGMAANSANYSLSGGLALTGAQAGPGATRATLAATGAEAGADYTLTVNNVEDVNGNPIAPDSTIEVTAARDFARIDFGPGTARTAPGWIALPEAPAAGANGVNYPSTPVSSLAGIGFTIAIDNVNLAGSPSGNIDWRDRGDSTAEGELILVAEDLIKNNAGFIRITLGALPPGRYRGVSYHVDPTFDQSDNIRVFVDGELQEGVFGDSDRLIALNALTDGDMEDSAAVFEFDADESNPVVILFDGSVNRIRTDTEAPINGLLIQELAPAEFVPPSVISVSPSSNETGVPQDTTIEVRVRDGSSPLTTGSIRLFFNDADVTSSASISVVGGEATVTYTPATLASLSENTVRVEFDDQAGTGPYSFEWSFTVRLWVDPATRLITSVFQFGGRADRPMAHSTGDTFDHPNLGNDFIVPYFDEDAPAFTDRVHQWNGASAALPLPWYLVGEEYIMIANDNRDSTDFQLDVTVSRPALVYLLIDNRHGTPNSANNTPPEFTAFTAWVLDSGWQPVITGHNRFLDPARPDEVGVDEGAGGVGPGVSINQYSSVYVREVPVGTVSLFVPDNAGRNMYGVVVTDVVAFPPSAIEFPRPGQENVWPATPIEVLILHGDNQVVLDSIELWFDGQEVTPTITGTAGGATVSYLPSLTPGATHTVRLEFADDATPPNVQVLEWSFIAATFDVPPEPFTGNIFMVTDRADLEAPGTQNLAGYLRLLGYTVDVSPSPDNASSFRGTLTQEQIDQLEASDLVIVHRATSSGSFSGDATAQWNNLEVPLWLGSSFLAREPNWSWTSGVQATATEQTGLTVDAPAHPIFAGLSGELFNRPIDINCLSNMDVGNGVLLAHVGDGMAAAAWEGAGLFRDAGAQTHQQRRVFFPIMRYHEDPAAEAGRFPDYSNNGLRLLANVVEYTMTGAVTWPPPIGLPVLGISIGAEGRIILDWTAPGFRLQSADTVTGPWEDVEGGTEPPVEIMPAEAMQFFQLAQ